MDRLIVKGLDALDGEYDFDGAAMISAGTPESLTNREGHRMKLMTGVRMGELEDALDAGDNDVLVALAAIILTRAGKRVDEEKLWDAPIGSGLTFVFATTEEPEEDDADVPPADAPPPTEPTEPQEPSGGASSRPTLVSQATGPSHTGPPASVRSAISDPETLAS